MKNHSRVIIPILTLILGVGFGFLLGGERGSIESREWRLGAVNGYTNPLLECEVGADAISSLKVDFTHDLRSFVDRLKQSKDISDLAVYYRDLNNGPTTGAGQDERFAPASLLKLPVLIAYLKWSEEATGVLDEVIAYKLPFDFGYSPLFAPQKELVLGESYTARELIERMIIHSDNQALGLLYQRIPGKYQEELFLLLGVDPELITNPTAELTVRQYSIFFRILFNASFLSRTNSEYALGLLARSDFKEGLTAGIPSEVKVAHKFGERKSSAGLQQFHDCGIVYYPKHPYLLCIMTRGNDVNALIDAIARTSDFVYKEIDRQYRK